MITPLSSTGYHVERRNICAKDIKFAEISALRAKVTQRASKSARRFLVHCHRGKCKAQAERSQTTDFSEESVSDSKLQTPGLLLSSDLPLDPIKFAHFPDSFMGLEAKRCLVLDNDETTGFYQLLSLFYGLHKTISKEKEPPPRRDVLKFLENGAARPGAKELIRFACSLKVQGRLDRLVIFTAAPNTAGWVTYLVSILEEYAGVPQGSVDMILSREDVLGNLTVTGPIVKDLRLICRDTSRTLMVDDKPHLVRFGNVLGVLPYEQHVDIEGLVSRIPCTKLAREFAVETLRQDSLISKPPSTIDFSQDRELFRVIEEIDVFFPKFSDGTPEP